MNNDCYVTEQLCAARRHTDEERFGRDNTRLDKAESRLDDMEKLLHQVSECNAKLTVMVESLKQVDEDHEDRISDLEKKPGAYWEKIVAGVIGAAVAAFMALVLKGAV